MPPRMMDSKHLDEMSGILRGIAKTLEDLRKVAERTEGGAGHEDPLVRINGSLANIGEVIKGLTSPGDHSAEYAQIESSFRAIAGAVKDLASEKPASE